MTILELAKKIKYSDSSLSDSVDIIQEKVLDRYTHYSMMIVDTPQYSKNPTIPFNRFSCVYFLMQGDYVAYVGQSTHLGARVAQHVVAGKQFDAISFVLVDTDDLLIAEAFNITHHNPSLNIDKKSNIELLTMVSKLINFD